MYVEGYVWEGLIETAEGGSQQQDPTLVGQEVHQSGGTTITDKHYQTTFSGQPGELSAFGLQAKTIPR